MSSLLPAECFIQQQTPILFGSVYLFMNTDWAGWRPPPPQLTVNLAAKMAENEGNGVATRTITAAEDPPEPPSAGESGAEGLPDSSVQPGQEPESSTVGRTLQTETAGSGALLTSLFPVEQSTMVGTEFTDLSTTTIIYVQPDGTLLEGGSGLTAEEQQAVLNQISKHQIMQVSDTEAAQLFQQTQLMETIPVQKTVLDSSQLQQVIDQVSKAQNPVQVPQQNNTSQQLKTVAQHVALQYSPVQVGWRPWPRSGKDPDCEGLNVLIHTMDSNIKLLCWNMFKQIVPF